jgi:hypothetical protein
MGNERSLEKGQETLPLPKTGLPGFESQLCLLLPVGTATKLLNVLCLFPVCEMGTITGPISEADVCRQFSGALEHSLEDSEHSVGNALSLLILKHEMTGMGTAACSQEAREQTD